MKTVIIIPARMTSTRLPGKVLKEVLGKPLLQYQIERLKSVPNVDEIVVATSHNVADDPIVEFCKKLSVACFRGDEHNVLSRYFHAAQQYKAKVIVRVPADCPLIDAAIVGNVIAHYHTHALAYDYVSNCLQRPHPCGMNIEVFSYNALAKAFKEAKSSAEKEYVTPYICDSKNLFRLGSLQERTIIGTYRLTVDTPEDFELIKRIIETLYPDNPAFTLEDALFCFDVYPEWASLNAHV
jgi:spore coat polysaccharide biosynthesis protein SpsF